MSRFSFHKRHRFTIVSLIFSFYFILAGLLESWVPSIARFHYSNPASSLLIWSLIMVTSVVILYRKNIIENYHDQTFWRVVMTQLSSMKVAVFLMGLAMALVFVGTIGQTEKDVWEAVAYYFRGYVARVPLSIFIPGEAANWKNTFIFLPGGYLLGGALFINLLAAQLYTFKLTPVKRGRLLGFLIVSLSLLLLVVAIWNGIVQEEIPSAYVASYKRVLYRLGLGISISLTMLAGSALLFKRNAGLVVLHFGIIMLIINELVTACYAKEGVMRIEENKSSSYIDIQRDYELALNDLNAGSYFEKSVTIPATLLRQTGVWYQHENLPVDIKVNKWFEKATVTRRRTPPPMNGFHLINSYELKQETSDSPRGSAAAEIVLRNKAGVEVATFIVSIDIYRRDFDQYFYDETEGKTISLALRNKRDYLYSSGSEQPFSIKLIDFRYDRYVGTNEAKNFSSLVHLIDPEKGVNRRVLISMNNPLRYSGRTFYQSSFFKNESGTVLNVVENPGWMMPYVCSVMVAIGMLFQFMDTLIYFMKSRKVQEVANEKIFTNFNRFINFRRIFNLEIKVT